MKRLVFLVVFLVSIGLGVKSIGVSSTQKYNVVVIDGGKIIQQFTSYYEPIKLNDCWLVKAEYKEFNPYRLSYDLKIAGDAIVEWSVEKIVLND